MPSFVGSGVNFMFEIKSEQMDDILKSLELSVAEQKTTLEACGLNVQDAWEGHSPHFIVVVREVDVQAHLQEVISAPENHLMLSEKRMQELATGASLTSEELANERMSFIKSRAEEDYAEVLAVVEVTDNARSAFVSFTAQPMGQLGFGKIQFIGTHSTREKAWANAYNLESLVCV